MTARPPIAQFGDAIEVKGERPSWLPDDVGVLCNTAKRMPASLRWQYVTAIRLEVPRYDFIYLALERGMVPWFGGDEAPGDWDGQAVLLRNGCVVPSVYRWAIGYPADGPKEATGPIGTDVIGYTRKATSTALPLAHPAAPQGGGGWYPMAGNTDWIDGRDVVLFAHGMEISARYCKAEWENIGLEREWSGAIWSAFDDAIIFDIEQLSHEPDQWWHGPVTHWRTPTPKPALAPAAIASGRGEGECICPRCGVRHGIAHTTGDF